MVVGSSKSFSIERLFIKYIAEMGVSVCFFPAHDIFVDYHQKLRNKVAFYFGFSGIFDSINERFKRFVDDEKPDLIWVFKGLEIFPESLRWAKRRKIKLINYNPDSPFVFSGAGSGNANITNSISLYDLHFTYNIQIKRQLESQCQMPAMLLPFGFDLPADVYIHCTRQPEIIKTCFVGNPDRFRSAFISQLAESGLDVDVYGHGWQKFISKRSVTIHPAVFADKFWTTLRRYRAQLNLMRPHNPESHNMRSFEVPGVGGIMVAPDNDEHRTFFEDGKEVILYDGIDDCVRKLGALLSATDHQVSTLRNAARNRSLYSGYTYKDRAKQALDAFESILCAS